MKELIAIVLNERAFTLRLSFQDIAQAEFKTGLDLMGENSKEFWDMSRAAVYKISLLIWVGMLHKYPEVTLDQVREWVTPNNLQNCVETVAQLLERDVQQVFDSLANHQKSQEPSEDPFTATSGSGSAPSPEST